MLVNKYLKLGVFLLISILVIGIGNDVDAKITSKTKNIYYASKKIKSKYVKFTNNNNVVKTELYYFNRNGKKRSFRQINYNKNKKMVAYYYRYNSKAKKIKRVTIYYYNVFAKKKTPLNTWYKVSAYSTKGKLAYTKYHTKEGKRKAIVAFAKVQNGKRYRSGGKGPTAFDCSGLTSYVYKKAVYKNIGSSSYAQNKKTKALKISTKTLKEGDILFWGSKRSPYHVGIYLGNGKYIHAGTATTGVQIKKLTSYKPSYAKRLI